MRATVNTTLLGLAGALLLATGASVASADAVEDAEALLASKGCLGCHSTDGRSRVGPTLAGVGERRDADYLRRAIVDPDADRDADATAAMPRVELSDEEVDALVSALEALPDREPPFEALWPLLLACGLFVGLHFVLSGPVRGPLVTRLGELRFQGLYSLVVSVPFVGLFVGWHFRAHVPLWDAPQWTGEVTLGLMAVAFVLLVAGYTTPGPTMAGVEEEEEPLPRGILTVTRHPALWGFLLWALAHIPPNGDVASLALFGSFAVLAFFGMLHIDARRRATLGARWEAYRARTSLVPFVALAQGRTRFDGQGLLPRVAIGLAAFFLTLFVSHELLTGVSPLTR